MDSTLDMARIQRRYQALRSERSGWDTAWSALAELFLPGRWRADTDESAHQGPGLNSRLVNSAGVLAMRTLAAGMQGGMTSPVRPWFRLVLKNSGNRGDAGGEMGAWLDEVTGAMHAALHQSNFYNAVHGLYADLGTFGTGLMVETADADGLSFHLVRAGDYVLDVNGRGEVDTFFRRIGMTARQIVDLWGDGGKVPPAIREAAAANAGQGGITRFSVIHGVFPRADLAPGAALGPRAKPFASVYFCEGPGGAGGEGGGPAVLSEGGFDMFPAFAPRWDLSAGAVYGRSPAMDVTPDCKMLQAMTATMRRMQHKIADPPAVADASLRQYGVDLDPGSLTFVDMATLAQAGNPVTPIQQPEPAALSFTMQGIRDVERVIQDGLYSDLFRMLLDDDRRQITATEIQARQQEKMILIGPVVERLHKELLEPLIARTFALMREWGALPEPPEGLTEGAAELDVSFESVLAQAQKLTATSAIEQGLAFMAQSAQVNPDVLDLLDFDAMGRAYLERIGLPGACVRDESDIADLRARRAEAQARAQRQAEAQAAVQQMTDLSAAARNLGQTPAGADGRSLMDTLVGGLGAV
ncbi:MAG: head-tail connector protein [Desulfovibrionaceae bacterium]|nr:head-tail connector protein [Desulfovibrionaceae bacterium]